MTARLEAPQEAQRPPLIEVRCRACGRLLLKVDTEQARIETVCPDRNCRRYQTHDIRARVP